MRHQAHLCYFSIVAAFLFAVLVFTPPYFPVLSVLKQNFIRLLSPLEAHFLKPAELFQNLEGQMHTAKNLMAELWTLQQENLLLQTKLSTFQTLTQENNELKTLLALKEQQTMQAEPAYIFPTVLAARGQVLLLSKGENAGVQIGNLVLHPKGVVGVISATEKETATLLPLYNLSFGLGVEIERNGVRSILQGNGKGLLPRLLFLPETSDIKAGDTIVTSGVDGMFARGYPVGVVVSANRNEVEPFLEVQVAPHVTMEAVDYVLILKTSD